MCQAVIMVYKDWAKGKFMKHTLFEPINKKLDETLTWGCLRIETLKFWNAILTLEKKKKRRETRPAT